MREREFDFLGHKGIFLIISVLLVAVAAGSLAVRGLSFSIDFQGGTVVNITGAEEVSTEEVRTAFTEAGAPGVVVQAAGNGGYIIRTTEDDPAEANRMFQEVVATLGLSAEGGDVSTIGPGWGEAVTQASLLALGISALAILFYISLRYEYKMSLTAVFTLAHDVLIVLGIYALVGRDVSPSTIAALLAMMGYSLYDTIVVFHRIKENAQGVVRSSFTQLANHSLNQVLVRSINTGITSLIPVLLLLIFGGDTLGDFAFALVVGITIGAYSSIGVATPLYAMWKEREPKFQALAKKYGTS